MAEFYQQNTEFNFKKFAPIFLGIIGLIIIFAFSKRIFVTINYGENGVLFRLLSGMQRDVVYDQGLHVVAPWNTMHIYDVKIQESNSVMQVLSRNGLTIKMEVSYRYRPIPEEIGQLHDEIGQNYHERIIIPKIRSVCREVIGKYLPEELYSTKRETIESEIFTRTDKGLRAKHLELDAILIRDVELPASLQAAIENKLKQEQMALEYEFKLKRAKQEAERQKIEAEGKAAANDIINKSLTDKILQEKGIDATLQLANSPNSKIVVIGNSKNGMPLILGGEK
jgi:regulator of protease activity HflC (stomatin/prohibitin superfamily)